MRFITLSVLVLLSLLTSACDSKTAALAHKSLMSRPIINPPPSANSEQNMHAMNQTDHTATDNK